MARKSVWQVVPAVLTLALVACEESITGIPEPVVEAAPEAALQGAAAVVTGDLIAWWSGEVDSNDIFQDKAGNHHIVTNQGVMATDGGVVDQAFLFGGTDKFLEIVTADDLRPEVFTIDLWAQQLGPSQDPRHPAYKNGEGLGGQTGNDAALIQKAIDDGTFQGTGLSYKISWGDGVVDGVDQGIIVADVALSSAAITGTPRLKSKFAFNDGEWVHVALTVDGNRNATLYVNGELHDTFMGSGAPIYGNGSIVIGNRWLWDRDVFGGSTFNGCIDEGGTFETSVSFTDDGSGPWTAVVDYGDGNVENPAVASTSFGLSHTYAQDGTYTVTVTVTDDAGAEGSSSASVVVSNVTPVVDAGPDATILEGGTFESAGSFTDPGADSWNATVDYGDGNGIQPLALSGKDFLLSHTYAGNGSGPFTVRVTVQDDNNAGVGQALRAVEEGDEALVTVVYPLTIHQATVRLPRRGWWSRFTRDRITYAVHGRLPLSLLERFDPDNEDLTIEFAGVEQVISAGSFDRKHRRWRFKASRRASGVQGIELRDNGRFKIQARGPFHYDLRDVDFGGHFDFSLLLGSDIGVASIQLDRRLHFRSHDLDDDRDGDDDDDKSDRSEKSYKSEKSEKGRFLDADGDLVQDADDYRNKGRGRWLRRGR